MSTQDPYNLQGAGNSLQGSMPSLQGGQPTLQGSAPNLQAAPSAPPVIPPKQAIATPKVSYNDLTLKNVNGNQTVINTKTGTQYTNPDQLAQDLGVPANQIQWGQIAKAPSPPAATAQPYRVAAISESTPPLPTQSFSAPQQAPIGGVGSAPQSTSPVVLSQLMSALEGQVKTNNSLMDARNLILKQLYDAPLTPEEKAKLDPNILKAIESGDRNQIDMQLRLISDQVQGRVGTLDQSVQYLTKAYNDQVIQAETQRQNAIENVKNFVAQYGSNAGAALSALYGQQYVDQLKSMGIDINAFSKVSIPTVNENRYEAQYGTTGLTGDLSISIPGNTLAGKNNNPGNLRFVGQPGATQGVGGFARFDSPEAGYQALISQINLDASRGLTVQQFINKYAPPTENDTGTYIKQFNAALGSDGNTALSSLDINAVAQFMAKKESGTTVSQGGGIGGLDAAAVDLAAQQYLATGQLPALGSGTSAQARAMRTAILNRAAAMGGGSIPGVNKAQLSSLTSSLTEQTKYANTIERSINTVDANLNLLLTAADKVSNYQSPLANEWQRLAQSHVIGSGDLNAYNAALQTVRTEYSNILARGGQVTDAVRAEAARLIPDNINKAQLQQVVDVLKAEAQNVLNEAHGQVQSLQDQMNNILTGGQGAPSAGGTANDPLGLGL